MKRIKSALMVIVLACLCALAWASVFIWHNAATTILFTVCIIIWLLVLNLESNNQNDNHEKE